MDLWFSPSEVQWKYGEAKGWLDSCVEAGFTPFPRSHACFGCDRDLRLMCIAWAGQGIEAVGPAHQYTAYLYDMESGQACGPDEFLDTPAGRAGVWTSRLVAAVGNRDLQLVSDLTVTEMPELDVRAESLLRAVAHLTSERIRRRELAEIEAAVLSDMGQQTPIPPIPPIPQVPPPPIPPRRDWIVPRWWPKGTE
jgi:hypothetical protein